MIDLIEYEVKNHIAHITLNDPKTLNAFGTQLSQGLVQALEHAEQDDSVRVIVLAGAGGNFSSGGHIKEMLSVGLNPEDLSKKLEELVAGAGVIGRKLRSIPKPIIAQLEGAVAGAGFNLSLTCDFRIASNTATFIQSFVHIGLVPDAGGVFLLNKVLGTAKATELAMLGDKVKADDALRLGLVKDVVAPEELDDTVNKLATYLVHLPASSLATIKDMMNKTAFVGFSEQLDLETANQAKLAQSPEFLEGVTAFIEKRKPNYLK